MTYNKMLSYCRETALQGALVLAKSGRLELGDNILRRFLLACLQLSVDVDEDAVLSGLRTIMYPHVAAKTESGCTDPATDCTLRTAAGCGCCLVPALPPGICSCSQIVRECV